LRILYGVQTTGHGHLVRSTPIIRELRARGHAVDVLLSGPAVDPLWHGRIGPLLAVHPGLTFSAEGGRIRYWQTMREARPLRFLANTFRCRVRDYDLVVSDYEPVTAWAARLAGVRSVGIGHLYAFAWASVPRARGNVVTRLVMDQFAPVTDPVGYHWDPFGAPLVPPGVAPEARAVVRGSIDPELILVYLGFEPLDRILPLLRQFPERRFHVYGRYPAPQRRGHIEVRPASRDAFLADLATCSSVIANAGFTLASECLHLGVKLLVKPVHGQLEQESNCVALTQLGLGSVSRDLRRADVAGWLERPEASPQGYPDATGAVIDWLDAGVRDPVAALSERLWRQVGRRATGGEHSSIGWERANP
jgi:uncharacterized protein (TIGR00661 family)